VILIRDVGHYSDSDDLVFIVGEHANTREECQVIAQAYMVQVVFRVTQNASRPEIGFHRDRLPKEDPGF
jgi:hypothetical protein